MNTDENAEEMVTYRDGRSLRHGGSQHANKSLSFVRTGVDSRAQGWDKCGDGGGRGWVYMHSPK